MRWKHDIEQDFVVDYKSLTLFILYAVLMPILIYIYSQEKNIVLGLILNTIFYAFLSYEIYKKNKAIDGSKKWLQISAEALDVQIIQRMCFPTRNVPFYPRIKYRYYIENKKYVSENMFLQKCNQYYFEDVAKSLVKTLVKDNKIKCFVNPKNFEESIVITDVRKDSYLVWFLMTYFISFIMIYGLFF